jgi:hypothetical protein
MSPELWGIVIQTIVLIISIGGIIIKVDRRISRLESELLHIESITNQVPGISRAVARLEGRNEIVDHPRA